MSSSCSNSLSNKLCVFQRDPSFLFRLASSKLDFGFNIESKHTSNIWTLFLCAQATLHNPIYLFGHLNSLDSFRCQYYFGKNNNLVPEIFKSCILSLIGEKKQKKIYMYYCHIHMYSLVILTYYNIANIHTYTHYSRYTYM